MQLNNRKCAVTSARVPLYDVYPATCSSVYSISRTISFLNNQSIWIRISSESILSPEKSIFLNLILLVYFVVFENKGCISEMNFN